MIHIYKCMRGKLNHDKCSNSENIFEVRFKYCKKQSDVSGITPPSVFLNVNLRNIRLKLTFEG